MVPAFRLIAATLVTASALGVSAAQAQSTLRLHEAVAAGQRPLLCADRATVNLVIPVLARAAETKAGEADKSQRLSDIATRLQNEVCRRSAAEDVVILRCKLGEVGKISLVKVSALMQSEAAKGEQPFYAWTEASIDESGASAPGAEGAKSRWCGSERTTRAIQVEERGGGQAAQPDEPFTATPDIVLRIQQRLYDFGLRIEQLNGQLNGETAQNLTEFQKFANLPADGQLTKPTIEKLMTTPAPSPWVSFAFDGFGNFGADIGRTRRDAEMASIERLQRRSSREFKLSSVAAPKCLGFAVTRYSERGRRSRTNFTQAFTSSGDSIEAAARSAFDYCEREKGGGNCDVRYALCADGQGGSQDGDRDRGRRDRRDRGDEVRRFDRDNPPANTPEPRFDRGSPPLNAPGPQQRRSDPAPRFDPKDITVNAPSPTLRFDPENLPKNQQAPRFDPRNLPANSPNPNLR